MRRQQADAEPSAAGAWLLRLVGGLLMLSALAVSISRAPDRPATSLVARWAPAPSDFIEVDGLVVHLRDEGPRDGTLPPIVLLHDLAGSLHDWDGWADALAHERRVIRFDLPGAGLTGPRADEDYSPAATARFTARLLDALGVARADIAGHGRGAEAAWQLAAQAPARIDRVVLVNPTGLDWQPRAVPVLWRVFSLPGVRFIGESLLPRSLVADTLATLRGHAAGMQDGAQHGVQEEDVDRTFELLLREGNREALQRQLTALGADASRTPADAAAALPRLAQPVLVLWGEEDGWLPASLGERIAAHAHGRLLRLPGLGHRPQVDDPAASLAPVRAFLPR